MQPPGPEKHKFQAPQERILHDLSKHIIGPQALFCPAEYGPSHKRKEPADIAWVVNRCAILIYATSSGHSFAKKRDHNCRQLHKWLRAWKSGHLLKGRAHEKDVSFEFGDVDHIIGLSIIENGEIGCQYHGDEVSHSADYKLSGCATLTSSAMAFLAGLTTGPRDVIMWLEDLRLIGRMVTVEEFLSHVGNGFMQQAIITRNAFSKFHNNNIDFQYVISHTMQTFYTLKQAEIHEFGLPVLYDICFSDVMWFSFAGRALLSQLAPPGKTGNLFIVTERKTSIYRFALAAAANLKVAAENVKHLGPDTPGIVMQLSMAGEVLLPIMLIHPRTGQSQIEIDADNLRNATLS